MDEFIGNRTGTGRVSGHLRRDGKIIAIRRSSGVGEEMECYWPIVVFGASECAVMEESDPAGLEDVIYVISAWR